MKKKVICFTILLLVFSLGLFTNLSFAFSDKTEMINDMKEKFNILKEKGVIDYGFNLNNLNAPYNDWLDYFIYLAPDYKNSDGSYSRIFVGVWSRSISNVIHDSTWRNGWGNGSTSCKVQGYNGFNGNIIDAWWDPPLQNVTFDYMYTTIAIATSNMTLGEGEEYGSYYITKPPILVSFETYNDGNINVFYNGSSDTFLRFNLSRSVNQWALGKLDGLSGDVKVDLKLNRFMNGEFTTSVGSAQWYSGQKTSFGGLSIANDGVVYIKNDGIYYNQGYSLTFDVDGENVENYLFYFVPYAYSSSSGDLLSPDIDTNSDLEILQNLQDLVNIQNIGAIYDNSFGSGEIYNTLGYSDYDNVYSDYLKSCFQSLNDTFTLSGDVSVDVNFLGKSLTLRSSDFVVPDGPIKFFCSSFLVFGTIFYFYKQFSHFFHKLQEGDFESASETFAVDDESLLM